MQAEQTTYKIFTLDVWADEEEGTWDINNFYARGKATISEEASAEEIVHAALDEIGVEADSFLADHYFEDFCNGFIEVRRKADHYPVLHIQESV